MSLSQIELTQTESENPVDQIEKIATQNQWAYEREDEDEISICVTGTWTDYNIAFTWLVDIEAVHLACAFDLKVPALRRAEVIELVTKINEQMWIGHFDFWEKDGLIMFRHALVLAGGTSATDDQCEALLGAAVQACERHFQAFQFVVWAGKTAREALSASLFETTGRA